MAIDRSVTRPGGYAQGRYQRGLESWRRKLTPILAGVFGPFLIAGVVVLIVERQLLSWFAGMIFGVLVGVWLLLRDSPPRYVEQWQDGAEGERKTAKALRSLERRGWTVVHDIQQRYGNYDHIAVGPNGVYLLDSKNLQGIVEIKNGMPHLNRRHDPEAKECDRTDTPASPRRRCSHQGRYPASDGAPAVGASGSRLLVGVSRRGRRRQQVRVHPRLPPEGLACPTTRAIRSSASPRDRHSHPASGC